MMMRLGTAALLLGLLGGAGYADEDNAVKIEGGCSGNALTGFSCAFTNKGDFAGDVCAVVTISSDKGATDSAPACVTEVDPGMTKTVTSLVFTGIQPTTLCAESECTLKVNLTNIKLTNPWSPLLTAGNIGTILMLVLIVASSGWVFVDSKKKRAGGAIKVMSPQAWLACCLVMWIVVFPYYLIQRR